MTLDDAIKDMQSRINAACPKAVVKAVRMSDEEARLSVYAPSGDMQAIKDSAFQPALDLLNKDGLDVQVFVYDAATNPPPA
jgi:hypothetical protein